MIFMRYIREEEMEMMKMKSKRKSAQRFMLKQPKNIYNIFYLSQKSQKKNIMKWKREPQKIKKQNIMNGHRNENDDYEEWWILHEYIYNIYLKWKLENLYKKETYILYESEFSCCWFSCTIYDNKKWIPIYDIYI